MFCVQREWDVSTGPLSMRPIVCRLGGVSENTSLETGSGLLRGRIVDLFEIRGTARMNVGLNALKSANGLQIAGQTE